MFSDRQHIVEITHKMSSTQYSHRTVAFSQSGIPVSLFSDLSIAALGLNISITACGPYSLQGMRIQLTVIRETASQLQLGDLVGWHAGFAAVISTVCHFTN